MNGFEKLLQEVDASIPYYTKHLVELRKLKELFHNSKELLIKLDKDTNLDVLNFLEKLSDLSSLIVISILDLGVISKNLCFAKTDWEKIYFVKNSNLTIYETIDTYNNYRSFLNANITNKYSNLHLEHKEINTLLKNFKKKYKYDTDLKEVRRKTAGHIDLNFRDYFDTIIKLDGELAGKMIGEFLLILNKLNSLTFTLLIQEKIIIDINTNDLLDKIDKIRLMIENKQLPPTRAKQGGVS